MKLNLRQLCVVSLWRLPSNEMVVTIMHHQHVPLEALRNVSHRSPHDFRHHGIACLFNRRCASIANQWRVVSRLGSWSGTLCIGDTTALDCPARQSHRHDQWRAANFSNFHYSAIRTDTEIPVPASLSNAVCATISNPARHQRHLSAGGAFVNGAGFFSPERGVSLYAATRIF